MGTWLVLLALGAGVLGAIRLRRPQPSGAFKAAPAGQAPAAQARVVEDLDDAFERVCAAHGHEVGILLGARLHQLVLRGVPVRAIRRAPGERAVRVCFADGTVVLARGQVPGDFARIAWAMHGQSVRLAQFHSAEQGLQLDFRWAPDQRLAAIAVGLDQPD